MSSSTDSLPSKVLRRPLTVFLNEMDPQFAADLEADRRDVYVRAHLHLALLLNASVAISDANVLHSGYCHRFFANDDGLRLLRADDDLTSIAGDFEEVSPVQLCIRDNVADLIDLDRKEVERYGGRRPNVTAPNEDLPRVLQQSAGRTAIRFSLARCAEELTDYCRALFQDPAAQELDVLRHMDGTLVDRAINDFREKTSGGRQYALGDFYDRLSNEPNGKSQQGAYLSITKPGYQRGVPGQLGMPMTVAYRKRRAIEPTATLLPVPIQYAQSRLVTTEWGMEVLSDLSTSQIMELRKKKSFRDFIAAKSSFMGDVLSRSPQHDVYGVMLEAYEVYFNALDRDIRAIAGLSQRSRTARYAILLSKFTNQLTLTNCVHGIFIGVCAGTVGTSSYFAGNHLYAGNLEAVAANLGISIKAIGGAAWADSKLQGSFTLSFSSEEQRMIHEAEANLWFHEPFQVASYFGK